MWPVWKKVAAAVMVLAAAFVAVLAVLTVDGRAYERWSSGQWLKSLHKSWVMAGCPTPADPASYGYRNTGTTYVYTAAHVVHGSNYYGLFAFKAPHTQPAHFAVATNGAVLVLDDPKGVRLLKFKAGRGAAW